MNPFPRIYQVSTPREYRYAMREIKKQNLVVIREIRISDSQVDIIAREVIQTSIYSKGLYPLGGR